MDAVPSRSANAELRHELRKLGRRRRRAMLGAQPITQDIAQTQLAQTLQRLDDGRLTHQLQICRRLLVEQL